MAKLDLKDTSFSVPMAEENLRSLISQVSNITMKEAILAVQQITNRQLAHIIGLMTSMKPAVLPAHVALQELKNTM